MNLNLFLRVDVRPITGAEYGGCLNLLLEDGEMSLAASLRMDLNDLKARLDQGDCDGMYFHAPLAPIEARVMAAALIRMAEELES